MVDKKDILHLTGITISFFLIINWYLVLLTGFVNYLTIGQFTVLLNFNNYGEGLFELLLYGLLLIPIVYSFIQGLNQLSVKYQKEPRPNAMLGQTSLIVTVIVLTTVGVCLLLLAVLQ